jgi:hypothetical protein
MTRVAAPIRHQMRRVEKAQAIAQQIRQQRGEFLPADIPGPSGSSFVPSPYLFTMVDHSGTQTFTPPAPSAAPVTPLTSPQSTRIYAAGPFPGATGGPPPSLVVIGPASGNIWPAGGTLTLVTPSNTITVSNFVGLGFSFDTPGAGAWTVTPSAGFGLWSILIKWPFRFVQSTPGNFA